MLALLVCQFVPFWSLGEETVSINGYIWFCTDHENFTSYFQEALNDEVFNAGTIVGVNLITMLACVLGIVFCIKNSEDIWPGLISVICGVVGLFSYIAYPVYRMGAGWGLHVAVCVGMILAAGVSLVRWIKEKASNK